MLVDLDLLSRSRPFCNILVVISYLFIYRFQHEKRPEFSEKKINSIKTTLRVLLLIILLLWRQFCSVKINESDWIQSSFSYVINIILSALSVLLKDPYRLCTVILSQHIIQRVHCTHQKFPRKCIHSRFPFEYNLFIPDREISRIKTDMILFANHSLHFLR